MAYRHLIPALALVAAIPATTGCSSRDDRAAAAAALAGSALQEGNIAVARVQINRALAIRDDVSDYYVLSGRIAVAENSFTTAYTAYESALTLDRGNIEALTRLCQLAVSADQPERAERYADQLVQLNPGDKTALNVQAALAFHRGDKALTAQLLDRILKSAPDDAAALITRSHLLVSNDDYAGAARAAEASLAEPGDQVGRLEAVKYAYLKGGDVAGYRRTIARLARASPQSVTAQLDYARSLYDAGDQAGGFATTRQVLALRPGEVATADTVLHLWRSHGAAAMPPAAIVPSAADGPPETKAAFASYANAIARPDLALQALGDAGAAERPATAVNNAKIARAQALALQGQTDVAKAILAPVLTADPDQPRGLTLRASLRAAAGDRRGAIEDLRHALSGDPGNADARLALVDLQVASGDGLLAITTLQDALEKPGADPRLATRLARLLVKQGRPAEAAGVLTDYQRTNPFVPRPSS